MQNEVYVDLLFMINFSMDFLCLFLASRILRWRLKIFTALIASIIGGIYSIITLFLDFSSFGLVLTDIVVCATMCAICFISKGISLKQYMQSTIVYLACATALGGIMTVLFNLMNKLDIPINAGGDNISSWLFLLLAIISGISAIKGADFLKKKNDQKIGKTEIVFENKSVVFNGITDTGNMLKDPTSGKSVIITDIKATRSLLPDSLYNVISIGKIESLCTLPPKYYKRIRIIPSSTISGNHLLIGIIPDRVFLHTHSGISDVSAIFAPAHIKDLPQECTAIIPDNLYK